MIKIKVLLLDRLKILLMKNDFENQNFALFVESVDNLEDLAQQIQQPIPSFHLFFDQL